MKQLQNGISSRLISFALSGAMLTALISCSGNDYYRGEIYIKETDRIKIDAPVDINSVNKIKRGLTTKDETLKLFGPPTAIARKGKTMTLPPPGHLKTGYIEVDSDTFFEPFSLKFKNTDKHIVYYYYHPTVWGSESRLWIYINQTNRIVDDYIFRAPVVDTAVVEEGSEEEY